MQPPKPRLVILQRNTEYNPRTDLNKRQSVTLQIKPDQEFFDKFKKDAKYSVGKIKICLVTFASCVPIKEIDVRGKNLVDGIDLDIYTNVLRAENGVSKLLIELDGISRINADGVSVPDNRFSIYEKSIIVTVK